jgi:hypothetical protein
LTDDLREHRHFPKEEATAVDAARLIPVGRKLRLAWLALLFAWNLSSPPATEAVEMTVTWTDNSGGQAGFKIERKTGAAGSYAEIGQQAAGTTSYLDSTVAFGNSYCYRVRAFNSGGTSDYSPEACASPTGTDLSVVRSGSGMVVSNPAGISCGTACSKSYTGGTTVALAATPDPGMTFSGWSGGGCSGTGSCSVSQTGAVSVAATFAAAPPSGPTSYALSVNRSGSGTVSSFPKGINCGSACSTSFSGGTIVSLGATPGRNQKFLGWQGGGCSGTATTCSVTVNAATTVWASFGKK